MRPLRGFARIGGFQESDILRPEFDIDPATGRHTCGEMDVACRYCGAKHYAGEAVEPRSGEQRPAFGMCCAHGDVALPPIRPPPDYLADLLSGTST